MPGVFFSGSAAVVSGAFAGSSFTAGSGSLRVNMADTEDLSATVTFAFGEETLLVRIFFSEGTLLVRIFFSEGTLLVLIFFSAGASAVSGAFPSVFSDFSEREENSFAFLMLAALLTFRLFDNSFFSISRMESNPLSSAFVSFSLLLNFQQPFWPVHRPNRCIYR